MRHEENDEIVRKILEKIGQPVHFQYPANEGHKRGTLKDRAVVSSPGSTGVPYWDVVDLIEFDEESERWIRIGYYRKPLRGKLNWGSQTTITEPVTIWKRLLVQAAREKPWFMNLLNDVMKELKC
jgi:hypothetical protein